MKKSFRLLALTLLLCGGVSRAQEPRVACQLHYGKDGKFKMVQFTDTHAIAGDARTEQALRNMEAVLDAEKPDFVIHTGDVIFGAPAAQSARVILEPLVKRGIPFAVALGNHDSDFDLSRSQIYEALRAIPGNVNTPANDAVDGFSNDILTLGDAEGTDRVFYLFDSGNRDYLADIKSWGYIHASQIAWYRGASDYFKRQNGGKPLPALAFFHIPVPEYRQALHDSGNKARFLTGNIGEEPAVPVFNSGLYVAMREQGDVQAIVTGHDHNNDFVLLWQGFFFIYGRYSGCSTVYNDLKPNGARVFEFTRGDDGFRSWIRLSDGTVEQNLYLWPGMKSTTTPRD